MNLFSFFIFQYFKGEGFSLTDTVAFFDREQGGCERIKTLTGVSVHW